ncbi:MAG: VanZ family protein [Halanaerobium sp.]|nr:VanZ family protein [Halanaerobium sp.]
MVKKVLLVILLATHLVIFFLSGLDGQQIGGWLTVPDYLAHYLEYSFLSVLWFLYLNYGRKGKRKRLYLYPILLTILYGLTDEIHQLYVPGRVFSLTDLLADFCGAITGVLAGSLLVLLLPLLGGPDQDSNTNGNQD